MHQFLSVYYFYLAAVHVCHPQGVRLYLLSYISIWVLVDNILCSIQWCVRVCYVLSENNKIIRIYAFVGYSYT
jgi:hypothetical protein